jgi:transcriptional regulator with XRE-family HTH domain
MTSINSDIGERMREARETLPKPDRNLAEFSKKLEISKAYLSQMESGKKPIPIHLLIRVANETGKSLDFLLSGQSQTGLESIVSFNSAIEFLQKASALGVFGMESTRESALYRCLPFLRSIRNGEVDITASTLRGLTVDPNNAFVAELKKKSESLNIRILFTHLQCAGLREQLEGRAVGGIVDEVVVGIKWAHSTWNVPLANMKFVKSAPNTFTIFVSDGKNAVGLINPYPLRQQAYMSFTLLLQKALVPSDHRPPTASSIYEGLHNSNFVGPWDDGKITVDLRAGATESQSDADPAVQKAASELLKFLDRTPSKLENSAFKETAKIQKRSRK